MSNDLGGIAWNKREEFHEAERRFHDLVSKIKVELDKGWIILKVEGDSTTSYPVWGDPDSRNEVVDRFATDLKKALSGTRISDLA